MTILAKTELFGENLLIKFVDNVVYVSYKGLNISADVSQINSVMEKLKPIIGELDLSAFENIDVNEIIKGITITDDENGLNIAATLFGFDANILFDTTDNNLSIDSISVVYGELNVGVVPSEKANYDMPESNYYNVLSLLDLIDNNNEINLQAIVDELVIDININLETLTILAKTELFGENLFIKFVDNVVYVSYKGLNVSVNINDIESVMNKLKPIIGELDLSAFENIDVEEIIKGITVTNDENGLNIAATLFGFDANILFDTTDNNLSIDSISVVYGELNVGVVTSEKATYDMPTATYYNIVTLLDIIDDNGYISLSVDLDGTTILATLDLNTLALYATVEGVEIFAELKTGDVYLRYPGVLATMNFNDLEAIMEKLQPIIDKLAGDSALGDLNLSGMETLNVEDIISSIVVSETDDILAIGLNISGIDITLNCWTENNNLTFNNASVLLGGMSVTATQTNEPFIPQFNLDETYVNAKELIDELGQALCDIFTSDELSATLNGTIVSGNSTITVNANVEIKGLETAPQAKALLTIKIVTKKDDGTVSETNHEVFLLYNDLSLVADNAPNVYFYYNDLTNTSDKFEGSFTTKNVNETLEILKKIYKNMPELQDSLKFIFEADENGYPTIPESSINVETLINGITLKDGVLAANLNGTAFMSNLPESILATLSAPNNVLTLSLPSLSVGTMSINGLTITLGKPETAFDGNTFTYTPSGKVNDFSSINELLGALETTSRYRSFSITGKVGMVGHGKVLGIDLSKILNFSDKVTISAQLEIIKDSAGKEQTYAVVNLARENVSALGICIWDDYKGNTTLYFDPEQQMIYIKDVSQSDKEETIIIGYEQYWSNGFLGIGAGWKDDKSKPIYGSSITTTYKKYTVNEFTANMTNILLDMIHFNPNIKNLITTSSDHVSTATIENTFLGYSYANNTFSIDLDLEPLIGDIQKVHLDIGHDANMNINTLYAEMNVVSILDVKLNASLTTHAEHAQRLDGTIASERSSSNY